MRLDATTRRQSGFPRDRVGSIRRGAIVRIGACASLIAAACGAARGETRLMVHYALSVAGLSAGEGTWTVEIDEHRYASRADGSFTGIWRVLAGGDVFSATRGTFARGRPAPSRYEANFGLDVAIEGVRMELRDGAVTGLALRPPLPTLRDRVAIAETDRRGVLDPLTAALIPIPGTGDMLVPAACQRTLKMFDGGHRYDIALGFKRVDEVRAELGYRGPVVVCDMSYWPISGHSPTAWRVKSLLSRRGMEMWLAPIAGTRLVAPFRIAVPTFFGTAMLDATRWEAAVNP